jgi:ATP-dependent exoDNAse (exonuclease V) alpha subunit
VSSGYPNGGRLAQIVERAHSSIPPVPTLPDNPTQEEQLAAWRQLAAAYATMSFSLREALPLIFQEIHTIRSLIEANEEKATRSRSVAKRLPRRVK